MIAFDYVKEQIELLAFMFPSGKYSYEYDKFSGMHIVQVKPLSLYNLNDDYKDFETKLSIDFDNNYYPESILFVSDESLNQVSNPEFEITGIFYGLQAVITHVVSPSFTFIDSGNFELGENNFALAA